MAIEIIKSGIADSLQDEGRFGNQHLGIQPTGCMDFVGATIANYLLGNFKSETVLECFFPAAQILFKQNACIAISGANFTPTLNNQTISINQPVTVKAGDVLQFTKKKNGTCCYIAFKDGLSVTPWLNSGSTNLVAGMGGFNGRLLQTGDIIPLVNSTTKNEQAINWQANANSFYNNHSIIRIIKGPEWDWLSEDAKNTITSAEFSIAPNSNRMAYTLTGHLLKQKQPSELVSTAVTKGTVQLLPNGTLMVLMADHQTTGGYPRVLQIIKAAIPSFVQQQANNKISFSVVDMQTAAALLLKQERDLLKLKNACMFKLTNK
jgi:antagonist of KipI